MAGKLARIRPPAQLLHTLELGGKFNWKLLRECPMSLLLLLYSECESLTTCAVDKTPRSSSAAVPQKGIIGAFSTRRGTSVGELSYFPLTTVHSTSNRPFWYQLTYNPMSAEQTAVRCDVYSVKSTGNVELGDEIMEALKRELKLKVQALEGEQLRAVAASTMLPSRESSKCPDIHRDNQADVRGSGAQSRVSADVEAHLRQERRLGTEIKPAAVRQQFHSELSAKADQSELRPLTGGTQSTDSAT
jgi:hypothetical protein